ncbi:alkaline phosphatase-like protein [Leptotrombidium deliense]|uniref:alkaline phosphatase n=1 Tax=Leptotrombidium deliense TaxID=299467 RepID=A0A443RW47_9ACAR|nr:alkaline phosphatase-like protein [Leptotrombidium deliense]
MINTRETLVIATADHSQPLTINGDHKRGGDVLGETIDHFTMLLYGNGPGYSREDSLNLDSTRKNYRQKSSVFMKQSVHAGEDVPVYATGPGSQFLFGVYDQTFIPYVVSAAACIGPLSNYFSETKE